MNCSAEEPSEPLANFWTAALDHQPGSTSQRAYRACKEVLFPYAGEAFHLRGLGSDEGRYCFFKGTVEADRIDGLLDQLHLALRRLSAGHLTVTVAEQGVFYLNAGPTLLFEPFQGEEADAGDS